MDLKQILKNNNFYSRDNVTFTKSNVLIKIEKNNYICSVIDCTRDEINYTTTNISDLLNFIRDYIFINIGK